MTNKIKLKSIISFLFTYSTNPESDIKSDETYKQDLILARMYLKAVAFFGIMCAISIVAILTVAFYGLTPESIERTKALKLLVPPAFSLTTILFPSPLSMLMMNVIIYCITWSSQIAML